MSVNDYPTALEMLQDWVNADPRYRSFRVEYGRLDGEMSWFVKLWSRRWRWRKAHLYSDEFLTRAVVAAVEDANAGRILEETPF